MKSTGTTGMNAVDWEARVDFDRLRSERLARLKAELELSDVGAVLAFDFSNIRYMSATHIGTWAMDKLIRFSLLTRNTDPIVWDFGWHFQPSLSSGTRSRTLRVLAISSSNSGRIEAA